jgi:hypothetical protein
MCLVNVYVKSSYSPRLTSLHFGEEVFKYFNSYTTLQYLKNDMPLAYFQSSLKFSNVSLNKFIFKLLFGGKKMN